MNSVGAESKRWRKGKKHGKHIPYEINQRTDVSTLGRVTLKMNTKEN